MSQQSCVKPLQRRVIKWHCPKKGTVIPCASESLCHQEADSVCEFRAIAVNISVFPSWGFQTLFICTGKRRITKMVPDHMAPPVCRRCDEQRKSSRCRRLAGSSIQTVRGSEDNLVYSVISKKREMEGKP